MIFLPRTAIYHLMFTVIKIHFKKNLEKWALTLLSGFFLFFVLFFYKGFNIQQGISDSGHGLLSRAVCFGLVTSTTFMINEFYLSGLFLIETMKRKFLWFAWEIFSGASLTFLLFNYFWNWNELFWSSYVLMLFEYTIVMIFPIIFTLIITRKLRKLPGDHELVKFQSGSGKDQLRLRPESFLYIKSEDNYVEIYYISDDRLKNILLRNTLKNIERENAGIPFLLRCHRSYIVNPTKIMHVLKLNRQIQLDMGFSSIIPVSKKYHSHFIKRTHGIHSPQI